MRGQDQIRENQDRLMRPAYSRNDYYDQQRSGRPPLPLNQPVNMKNPVYNLY